MFHHPHTTRISCTWFCLIQQLYLLLCVITMVTSQVTPNPPVSSSPKHTHNDIITNQDYPSNDDPLPFGYLPRRKNHESGLIQLGYITGSRKPPKDMFYERPGQYISGAITLAVDKINNDTMLLPHHRLMFVIAETYGDEEESIRQTVRLQEQGIDAYIGEYRLLFTILTFTVIYINVLYNYYVFSDPKF